MYGDATREIQAVCEERTLPLHVFPWRPEMGRAGLRRNAVYLVRPDGYVALADPGGSARGDHLLSRCAQVRDLQAIRPVMSRAVRRLGSGSGADAHQPTEPWPKHVPKQSDKRSSMPTMQNPRVVAFNVKGDGFCADRLHRFAVERFRVSVFVAYTCRCAVRWPRG